jgi:hypothetical protein
MQHPAFGLGVRKMQLLRSFGGGSEFTPAALQCARRARGYRLGDASRVEDGQLHRGTKVSVKVMQHKNWSAPPHKSPIAAKSERMRPDKVMGGKSRREAIG